MLVECVDFIKKGVVRILTSGLKGVIFSLTKTIM